MAKFLGEFPVTDLLKGRFKDFGPSEWAMEFIHRYSGIDGAHHKDWLIDQVARILNGTPVEVTVAVWEDGIREYRISTGEPSEKYKAWVIEMLGEYDEASGEYEYDYDEGIAP